VLTVTVYSTPNCQQCKATYRHHDKLEIGYTIVDLTAPENAELLTWITDDLGYDAAPVVVVDQDPDNHWSKYRPDHITRLAAAAASERLGELRPSGH
jgi:glutaredoxin-like protein NrdH